MTAERNAEIKQAELQRKLCIVGCVTSAGAEISIILYDVLTQANKFNILNEVPGSLVLTGFSYLCVRASNKIGERIEEIKERN